MTDTEKHVYSLELAANSLEEEGFYVLSSHCWKAISYIELLDKKVKDLEEFQTKAFEAYPNIDLDIETMEKNIQ